MDPHRLGELRSLEYHRRIASRLAAEPQLIDRARERLLRWKRTASPHSAPYLDRWLSLLEGPREQLLSLLTDSTPEASTMRQIGPFAGELSPKERWRLWREVREREEGRS